MYEAIFDDTKSHWFLYVAQLLQECASADEAQTSRKLISTQCHDDLVQKLAEEDDDGLNIRLDTYDSCVSKQGAALDGGEGTASKDSESFLDRDRLLERRVGSMFHPSISVNNQTYRGDYRDPNKLFKGICSTMAARPYECKRLNFVDPDQRKEELKQEKEALQNETDSALDLAKTFAEGEADRQMMDRRAKTAEVILAFVILAILSCGCGLYFNLYNKKKSETRLQAQVNEQVAQYF